MQRTKIKGARGGHRKGSGRKVGSFPEDVQRKLYEVTRLEAEGMPHAEAIRTVAASPMLQHSEQALRRAYRDWRDREFLTGRRVMTIEQGYEYVQQTKRMAPPIAPCSCGKPALSQAHTHCSICREAIPAEPGPQLLDGRFLNPVCGVLDCFWAEAKRTAPDFYKAAHGSDRARKAGAKTFHDARVAAGLSQDELAKKARVPVEAILAIEQGLVLPLSENVVQRIKVALGLKS